MINKSAKAVALSLSVSLLLSACQTTGANNRPLTPAEQRMREQADTYNQTIFEGGGKKSTMLADGAIGCVAGAAIGGGVGAYVADKQEKYATKEEQLDSMITDVKAENQRLAGLVTATQQVIVADKARLDQIDKDLASGKITMAQAKEKIAAVDDNKAYLDNTIAELRKRQTNYADAASQTARGAPKSKVRAMNEEITTLEKQIAQLEAERDSLAQRRTVSRVG